MSPYGPSIKVLKVILLFVYLLINLYIYHAGMSQFIQSTYDFGILQLAWEPIVGSDFQVVVAQLAKFKEGGGLGISLEGTVDVEDGVEVRPHHYIRSILGDGPVGSNGVLKSSDELLEVCFLC